MLHSFLQESDTADDTDSSDDEGSLEGNYDDQNTQGHEEVTSHAQTAAQTTQNTETKQ